MDQSPASRYSSTPYISIAAALLVISGSLLIFAHLARVILGYWIAAGVMGAVSPFAISVLLRVLRSMSYRGLAILISQVVYLIVILTLSGYAKDVVPKDLRLVAEMAVLTVGVAINLLCWGLVPGLRGPQPET